MSWLQLNYQVDKTHCEALETLLSEHGALAITLKDAFDEAQFENNPGETPLWSSTIVSALFDAELSLEALTSSLIEHCPFQLPACRVEYLADKNWQEEWMKYFQPAQVGSKLWICPSWHETPSPDSVNLILDPGLAFGTGTHPTTLLCLQWIDQHAEWIANKEIVDFGCGSGILGVAACLFDAAQVIGVDHDAQAIIASEHNASLNQLKDKHFKVYLPQDVPSIDRAELILANILAKPLIELMEHFASMNQSGDRLILSGILDSQEAMICDHYQTHYDIAHVESLNGWLRIDCVRR